MEIGRLVHHLALHADGHSRLVQHLRSQLRLWRRKFFRSFWTTGYAVDLDSHLRVVIRCETHEDGVILTVGVLRCTRLTTYLNVR